MKCEGTMRETCLKMSQINVFYFLTSLFISQPLFYLLFNHSIFCSSVFFLSFLAYFVGWFRIFFPTHLYVKVYLYLATISKKKKKG